MPSQPRTREWFEEKISEFAVSHEFSSFWLGVVLSSQMEAGLSAEARLKLKQEMKRSIGLRLEQEWKKRKIRAQHDSPDVLFTLDFHTGRLKTEVKPLLVFGYYRKLSRKIPQSKWPCRKCNGGGCDHCHGKGAMYTETVEGFLAKPLLKATRGKETKMHAVGREDIDARMLGDGRPFILAVINPMKRSVDLKKMENEANKAGKGKSEVLHLSFASAKELEEVKAAQPDKVYKLVVECSRKLAPVDLKKVLKLKGKMIAQKTPERVLHRRADLLRKRKIKKVKVNPISASSFELELTVQSGTYVKELVSGDNGRTTPSVSQLLNCKCTPKELDVLKVAFKPKPPLRGKREK